MSNRKTPFAVGSVRHRDNKHQMKTVTLKLVCLTAPSVCQEYQNNVEYENSDKVTVFWLVVAHTEVFWIEIFVHVDRERDGLQRSASDGPDSALYLSDCRQAVLFSLPAIRIKVCINAVNSRKPSVNNLQQARVWVMTLICTLFSDSLSF